MASSLPKVRSNRGGQRAVVWVLAGVVAALFAVIGMLLLGGPLFDDSPQSDLERDYALLTDALRSDPDNPAILITLAETEYELGRTGEALDHAAQAAEVSTSTPGFPVRYAQLLLLEGEYELAEQNARLEIELDTDEQNAGARFILGQILFESGQPEEAFEMMDAGLLIDYTAADMRIIYADMLAEAGEDDRAIEQYETALQFLPSDQRALDGLAALGVSYEATSNANPHETTGTETP